MDYEKGQKLEFDIYGTTIEGYFVRIEEDKIIFIKDDPPDHCKYTLEHVISDQDNLIC